MSGPRPSGRAPQQGGSGKPRCILEIIDPDDILIVGVNGRWFRTFTSSSTRYPLEVEVPAEFINDSWNLVSGDYTNVALTGPKNDASVEYKLKVNGQDMVHVTYRTEVQNHTFTVHFKDTFSLKRGRDRGTVRQDANSKRFSQYMDWSESEQG